MKGYKGTIEKDTVENTHFRKVLYTAKNTIYSPAHHRDGVVYATKAEAVAANEEFDGVTTE